MRPASEGRFQTHAPPRVAATLGVVLVLQWLAVFRLAGELRIDVDVLLLLPIALACVYGIGAILSGARIALFASVIWAFAPFLLLPLFDERYRDIYERDFLEPATGLTGAAEFRAAVALLVSAFFTARAIRTGGWVWGALAGAAAAVACAVDSSSALFLPAPVIALAVARRWLPAVPLAGGLAIGLVFAGLPSTPGDLGNLDTNQDGIREFFWSVRVLEWLPLAGVLGAARRSPPIAALLGFWFGAYLLVRGTDPEVTIGAGTFFGALLPAWPAYVLLAAAIPLLAPPLPALRGRARSAVAPPAREDAETPRAS